MRIKLQRPVDATVGEGTARVEFDDLPRSGERIRDFLMMPPTLHTFHGLRHLFSRVPHPGLWEVVPVEATGRGEKTVWEVISDGSESVWLGRVEVNSRAYVGRFNFRGADQQKRVRDLSGGERNRVHLAKMLRSGGNLLLLDEPTNDLDVETLRALEEALLEFPGCAVVISHDRWFLDRIATHILAYEDDGGVVFHEGNFSDYEEDRKARLGAAAAQPHRVKYRKLK